MEVQLQSVPLFSPITLSCCMMQLDAPMGRLRASHTGQAGPSGEFDNFKESTTDLKGVDSLTVYGWNSAADMIALSVGSNVLPDHDEGHELLVRCIIRIIVIVLRILSEANGARDLLDTSDLNGRALQASPMKVSMLFTVTDADGQNTTTTETVDFDSSDGSATVDLGLSSSQVDQSGTGLCDNCSLEVEPIECLENCDNYDGEQLAEDLSFTYDVSMIISSS